MILKDYIKTIDDEYIYIGSAVAFMCIGKVSEVNSLCAEADEWNKAEAKKRLDSALRTIEQTPKRRKNADDRVKRAKDYIKQAMQIAIQIEEAYKSLTEYALEADDRNPAYKATVTKFETTIEELKEKQKVLQGKMASSSLAAMLSAREYVEKNYQAALRGKATLEPYLNHYKPILERQLIEHYKREAVEPLGEIVIVEGSENGRYWSFDEIGKDITELEKEDYE